MDVAHHPHGGARVLERHEADVVERDEAGGEDDHAPVAVDQQEREHAEDVEVHLDQAVRLADEERGVRQQSARDEHPGPERAGRAPRQQVRAARGCAPDQERREPGAMDSGQAQSGGEVQDEEEGQKPVRAAANLEQLILGRGDGGHTPVIGPTATTLRPRVR